MNDLVRKLRDIRAPLALVAADRIEGLEKQAMERDAQLAEAYAAIRPVARYTSAVGGYYGWEVRYAAVIARALAATVTPPPASPPE